MWSKDQERNWTPLVRIKQLLRSTKWSLSFSPKSTMVSIANQHHSTWQKNILVNLMSLVKHTNNFHLALLQRMPITNVANVCDFFTDLLSVTKGYVWSLSNLVTPQPYGKDKCNFHDKWMLIANVYQASFLQHNERVTDLHNL